MTISYIITSKNTVRLLEFYNSTTNLFELSQSRTRITLDKGSFEIEIKWLQKQWTSCWRSASPQGMLYFRAKNVRYDALPSWIIHFNSIFVCTLSQYCVKFGWTSWWLSLQRPECYCRTTLFYSKVYQG